MRALVLALSLFAAGTAAGTAAAQDGGAASDDVAKSLWTKRCAGCHGGDGKGDTKVGKKYKIADLTDPAWALAWSKARTKKVVEDGVEGQMPAWKMKLSPEEIDAVTAYVFTLARAGKK